MTLQFYTYSLTLLLLLTLSLSLSFYLSVSLSLSLFLTLSQKTRGGGGRECGEETMCSWTEWSTVIIYRCLSVALSVSLPLSASVFLSSRSHERRAREGQKDRHIERWTESEERTSRNGEGDYRG